ncbi:MAG: hypothetical protein R3C03_16400 [Pirellulaceae bacterium]
MKIHLSENTPNRIVIGLVPTAWWAVVVFGLLFFALGPLVIWLLGFVVDLKLDEDEFVYRKAFFGQFWEERKELNSADIRNASTEIYEMAGGRILELTIHTKDQKFAVPLSTLDGDAKELLAAEINDALDRKIPFQFNSGSGGVWSGVVLGLALVMGGMTCIYFLQSVRIIGDRHDGTLCVSCRRWISPFTDSRCIEMQNITGFEIDEVSVGGATTTTGTSYCVYANTKSGETLNLSKGPMFTEDSARELVQRLGDWLWRKTS